MGGRGRRPGPGRRLERARQDLAERGRHATPVHAIAARWGFPHHPAFTRAFRAAYGLPPRDYRHRATTHDTPRQPTPPDGAADEP